MNHYAIRHTNTQAGVLFYVKDLPKQAILADNDVNKTVLRVLQAQQEGFQFSNTSMYALDQPSHSEISTQVCWQAEAGQLQVLREVPLTEME